MAGNEVMSAAKARKMFGAELLKMKMNDDGFVEALNAEDFFSGNTRAQMESKSTEAEKASYFLKTVIDLNVDKYFIKLLNVMEKFDKDGDAAMHDLAQKIKRAMGLSKEHTTVYIVFLYICAGTTFNSQSIIMTLFWKLYTVPFNA